MYSTVSLVKAFKAALQGGLVSAVINLLWYSLLSITLSFGTLPKGFMVAIVISSVLPLFLGAVVYVLLVKNFLKGQMLYFILATAFAIFSIFPSFQPILPDGSTAPHNFALLTVPMHFIVAVIGSYFLVKRT